MMKVINWAIDLALVMMLYEGRFSIGEIGIMRWGDLMFDRIRFRVWSVRDDPEHGPFQATVGFPETMNRLSIKRRKG
ncbi:hypothetical protein [Methanosphaerula palustris]|uniref:Uncharacterized protein n=1 Tax=Methanosphaerula palustris (strain ATCC BAA-1556 / DSM 19958 / E1-9c) TaxID=521011 RepID=B8GDF5_METPE|nr:hypothetical protein [Methanosphaerula palustris]ACL17306.1 hypothetical protein Mpal_2003 [Methanosphaerula palustris E1-9c]